MAKKYNKDEALGLIRTTTQERHKFLFDYAPTPQAYVSVGGDFLACNQSLCRFLEYSDIELCGKTFTDITHPEDIGVDWANLKKLEHGEIESDTYTMYKRYITKTGQIVPLFLTVYPVRDENTTVMYYVAHIVPDEKSAKTTAQSHKEKQIKKSTKEAVFDFVVDYYQQIFVVIMALGSLVLFFMDFKNSVEENTNSNQEAIKMIEKTLKELQNSKANPGGP